MNIVCRNSYNSCIGLLCLLPSSWIDRILFIVYLSVSALTLLTNFVTIYILFLSLDYTIRYYHRAPLQSLTMTAMNVMGLVCRISPHKITSTLCRQRAMFSCFYPTFESSNTNLQSDPMPTSCYRTFSTTSVNCRFSDKLGRIYLKRDIWKMKRKDLYKRFSASRFVNAAPDAWKPYLQLTRVDKPIGTWLLYLPCAFGICFATPLGSLPDLYHLGKM